MIKVPEEFARWRTRVDGEAGREWLRSLPALVERLAARWDLTVDDAEPLHGGLGLVVLARREGQRLALKLSRPGGPVTDEVAALRAWDGRGAVHLLDAEPEAGALLLERLDHTRSLRVLPLWEAAEIAGALIRTLAVAPPAGLRTLTEIAAGTADHLTRRQQALGDPVPARWMRMALRYASELPSAGDQALVHADLHYGNVLAGTRQPWLATDPRAVQGVAEYSVPELMWTRADEMHTHADVRRLLDLIVAAAELDAGLAYGWVVTRCVDYWLWGLERGLTVDPARCEAILGALIPGSRWAR
ncbi:aminoglycoside phosphotransferase family protein [Actinoplanes sp. NEAU-A12]|uniref:Aminoglycoside phosphotransferase family protein n=1 Tax=Actinoplanes sandaracinus TaxID=3045177 RepID=A0ABT6WR29_9ACTN|nr:aminoglycoside phosphotransferase family protein [Actinoplanes sandaracinus]MDI6102149.1 aminoglycoside phosphotransferase family protein [Actinoplanes sandaracinus]